MVSRGDLYVGGLGVGIALAGVVEVLAGVSGTEPSLAFVSVGGAFLLWRGVIVLSAGAFLLTAARGGTDVRRNQGIVLLGAIMLWIVAGTDVLARILGAIPGGSDVWVTSLGGFVGSVSPPYSPAIVVSPFVLIAVRYVLDGEGRTARGVEE